MGEAKRRKARDMKMIESTVITMTACSLMALQDKFDFTKDQLERFLHEVNELFDSVTEGYVDIEGIIETISAETGLNITYHKVEG